MRRLDLKDHITHRAFICIVFRNTQCWPTARQQVLRGCGGGWVWVWSASAAPPPNPGTLGLLPYLSLLLCNMGWAVTVPFHERQHCIMNESSGPNKAKVHGLGKPQTQGETRVCMAERQNLGMFWLHVLNWSDLWEDILECQIFIYIKTLSLHTHLFWVARVLKMGPWSFFHRLIPTCGPRFSLSWGEIDWNSVLVDSSHCNE